MPWIKNPATGRVREVEDDAAWKEQGWKHATKVEVDAFHALDPDTGLPIPTEEKAPKAS